MNVDPSLYIILAILGVGGVALEIHSRIGKGTKEQVAHRQAMEEYNTQVKIAENTESYTGIPGEGKVIGAIIA